MFGYSKYSDYWGDERSSDAEFGDFFGGFVDEELIEFVKEHTKTVFVETVGDVTISPVRNKDTRALGDSWEYEVVDKSETGYIGFFAYVHCTEEEAMEKGRIIFEFDQYMMGAE